MPRQLRRPRRPSAGARAGPSSNAASASGSATRPAPTPAARRSRGVPRALDAIVSRGLIRSARSVASRAVSGSPIATIEHRAPGPARQRSRISGFAASPNSVSAPSSATSSSLRGSRSTTTQRNPRVAHGPHHDPPDTAGAEHHDRGGRTSSSAGSQRVPVRATTSRRIARDRVSRGPRRRGCVASARLDDHAARTTLARPAIASGVEHDAQRRPCRGSGCSRDVEHVAARTRRSARRKLNSPTWAMAAAEEDRASGPASRTRGPGRR